MPLAASVVMRETRDVRVSDMTCSPCSTLVAWHGLLDVDHHIGRPQLVRGGGSRPKVMIHH